MIEQRKILIHCGNIIFVYHDEFNKYINVEGAHSKEVFDYLFDIGVENFRITKGKEIST